VLGLGWLKYLFHVAKLRTPAEDIILNPQEITEKVAIASKEKI